MSPEITSVLEPPTGFEPITHCLQNSSSTVELGWHIHACLSYYTFKNLSLPPHNLFQSTHSHSGFLMRRTKFQNLLKAF